MGKNCLSLAGKLSVKEWAVLRSSYGWWEYLMLTKHYISSNNRDYNYSYHSMSQQELLFISRDKYLLGLKRRMKDKPIWPEEVSLLKKLEEE